MNAKLKVLLVISFLAFCSTNFLFANDVTDNVPIQRAESNDDSKEREMTFDDDFWNPFVEMERIRQQMNSLFSNSFNKGVVVPKFSNLADSRPFYQPALDFSSDDKKYFLEVDLPGVEKENIKVEIKDGVLVVSGERFFEATNNSTFEEDTEFYRKERSFGSFKRSVPLPDDIDSETIAAEYLNGVLFVSIPKRSDVPEGRQILIK